MRFVIRKRRQPPAIIIVALIDILVVLLIFLMVTSTIKQQPALKLALPESNQAHKSGATETPPLIVTITANGMVCLGANQLPLTMEQLQAQLQSQAAHNPQLKIALSADKAAPFGQIVKVMDAAKAAGIQTINAFTKEAHQ
ncbi:MAG TPA: biopolymer transporter ExbD [Dongiaceae bacterium]|nr:biopolymer transporter ExbD [Dongiaceae bacterium]